MPNVRHSGSGQPSIRRATGRAREKNARRTGGQQTRPLSIFRSMHFIARMPRDDDERKSYTKRAKGGACHSLSTLVFPARYCTRLVRMGLYNVFVSNVRLARRNFLMLSRVLLCAGRRFGGAENSRIIFRRVDETRETFDTGRPTENENEKGKRKSSEWKARARYLAQSLDFWNRRE